MKRTTVPPAPIRFVFRLCALALCSTTLAAASVEATRDPGTIASGGLASVLDASGYLDLPPGFSGTLDPSGFQLISEAGEAPRFRAADHRGSTGGADDRWSDGFGLGNGCNGPVHAITTGDDGEVYLGGSFDLCGDTLANNVVRYNPGDSTWAALGSGNGNGVDDLVRALAFRAGEMYVGGSFTQANAGDPVAANRLARWDGSTWSAVGTSGGNGVNNDVHALAVSGSSIYVGGVFTSANIGGPVQTANRIIQWTGSAWGVVGSGGGNGTNQTVHALAATGSNVYVGGEFTQVNAGASISANYVAVWNGSNWLALGSGAGNGVNNFVTAFAVAGGGNVFVGGDFNNANVGPTPVLAQRVALWNGSAWSNLGSGVSGTVRALRIFAGNLYAGGLFNSVGSAPLVTAHNLARWDGSAWTDVGTDGGEGAFFFVRALAVANDALYVGGQIYHVNLGAEIPASNVVRWTGSDWSVLTSSGNGANFPIIAMAVFEGDVYVGGEFTQVGGVPANHLARWDGNAWSPVGSGGGNGVDASVWALAVFGGDLIVGGGFVEVNVGAPLPANRLARWNGSSWSTIGSGGGNGFNGTVLSLAVSGSDLYATGDFSVANLGANIQANRIARWNGSTWSALGSGGGNGLYDIAYTMEIFEGDVYVGGRFTQVNVGAPIAANRIARWNGSAWSAVGSGAGNGMSGTVSVLAANGGYLYAGGNFIAANVGASVTVNRLARWNGSAWSGIGSGGGLGFNDSVRALAFDGDKLYAAGSFTQANVGAAIPAQRMAVWDGGEWSAMGSGIAGNTVFALLQPEPDTLYAGGYFYAAGDKGSANFARYATLADLQVELSGIGTGNVTSTPPGIDCPGVCNATFATGTPVTLAANADPGTRALGWSGIDCPGSGPCSFELNGDRTIVAGFGSAAGRSLRYYGNGSAAPGLDRVTVSLQQPPRPANIGDGDFTLELWLRADAGNDSPATCIGVNDAWIEGNIVIDRDTFGDGDHGDFGLSIMAGRLAFGVGQGALGTTVCGSTDVLDGAWHHVAVTRNGTTGLVELWLDGALEHSEIGPTGDISYRTDRPTPWPWDPYLVFGAEKHDVGPAYPSYSGWLDEVRLSGTRRYSASFTPELVLPADAHTVAVYRFDAGAGTVVFDEAIQTGGSSHGQLRHGGAPAGPCWSKDTPVAQRIFAHGFDPEGCAPP